VLWVGWVELAKWTTAFGLPRRFPNGWGDGGTLYSSGPLRSTYMGPGAMILPCSRAWSGLASVGVRHPSLVVVGVSVGFGCCTCSCGDPERRRTSLGVAAEHEFGIHRVRVRRLCLLASWDSVSEVLIRRPSFCFDNTNSDSDSAVVCRVERISARNCA
jgi:hypothetical protein